MQPDNETASSRHDERVRTILKTLRDGRMSILDLVLHVLDSNNAELKKHQAQLFSNPSGKLTKIFDRIYRDKDGHVVLLSWMEPLAIKIVLDRVAHEMDDIKTALPWSLGSTTPESLTWGIDGFIGPLVENKAPTLGRLLRTATQMKRAKEKNKIKSCTTACNMIVAQLAMERSKNALYFAIPFTLFLWTNRVSRQALEILHKCGLCASFSSLSTLLHQLSTRSLERAARIARGPHVLCWDNINIKTSIFVEQRDFAPAKVQSGTFSIVYQIDANPSDMSLAPMLARAQHANNLTFNGDIRPTSERQHAFHGQVCAHIIDILLQFSKSFNKFKRPDDLRLVHQEH